jgi:hypothetical protein
VELSIIEQIPMESGRGIMIMLVDGWLKNIKIIIENRKGKKIPKPK